MPRRFTNCECACPYWLSTIRALQLPPLQLESIPVPARPLFHELAAAVREGRLASAGVTIEQARPLVDAASPAFAFVQIAAAGLQLQGGDVAAACQTIDTISPTHAGHSAVLYSRGVIDLQRKQYERAMVAFEGSVAADPSNAAGWAALAVIHAIEQNHAATETAAREALRLGNEHFGLVPLALMQATYLQGKRVEGAMDFGSLEADGEAVVEAYLPGFPPVDLAALCHDGEKRPIYFIYADHAYVIEHAIPLILSLKESAGDAAVHLHVANPGNGLRRILDRLKLALGGMPLRVSGESVVVEQYAAPAIYHSCMRFVRMYQLLRMNEAPVIMLDADVLVRKNPVTLVHPGPIDVVVSRSPHDPFWSTYYGGYVEVHPTGPGRAYLAQVAAFILDNIRKGVARWFLDQTALATCADKFSKSATVGTLPPSASGVGQFTGHETFWTAVNQDKYADNEHTREKRRLRDAYGFQPDALEPDREAELIATPTGKIFVPKDDSVVPRTLRIPEPFRKREFDMLAGLLPPGGTVVEAWANVGGWTIPLARRLGPRGRVFAFEPDRFLCQLLQTNITINGLRNVFAEQRRCVFAPPNSSNRRLFDDDQKPIAIDELSLDACHLLCLDVEDAEWGVIAGADATLRRFHPMLYVTARSGTLQPHSRRLLESLAYRIHAHSAAAFGSAFLCLPPESRVQISEHAPMQPAG